MHVYGIQNQEWKKREQNQTIYMYYVYCKYKHLILESNFVRKFSVGSRLQPFW